MVSRRSAIAGLLAAGSGLLAAGSAAVGGQSEGGQDPYGAEGLMSAIPLKTDALGRLRITRILMLTDRGAFAAALHNAVYPRNEDRLGFPQDIPLVGRLFQPTIRARDLLAEAMIGRVYAFGDILVAELRQRLRGGVPGTAVPLEQRLDALAAAPAASATPLVLPVTGVPVRAVSTVNDRSSYHVSGAGFRHVGDAADVALLAAVPALQSSAVGEAFAKDPDVVLLARPSIVNDWR